jgi:hypothetical protein
MSSPEEPTASANPPSESGAATHVPEARVALTGDKKLQVEFNIQDLVTRLMPSAESHCSGCLGCMGCKV